MTIEYATNLVSKELSKLQDYGYIIKKIDSKSTNSVYFKIIINDTSLLFRISDHKSHKNITTLRTDLQCNDQSIKGFITNRIKDFEHRRFKDVLGIRHGRI